MSEHNELLLYGVVGKEITAQGVRESLAAMDHSLPLYVRMDSPGGRVDQGFSIAEAIGAYEGKTIGVVESSAFSIMSYIACACDELEMASNGFLMIHRPSGEASGDDEQIASASKAIAKFRAKMTAAYADRSGQPADVVEAWMKEESHFSAQEAKAVGLADRVLPSPMATRIAACHLQSVPFGVVASLRCEAASGDLVETKDEPMATAPVAATVKSIKSVFPKASADFIVRAMEEELTDEDVVAKAMETLQAENDKLQESIQAKDEEIESLKAKAGETETTASADDEEVMAKARAAANGPVATAIATSVSAKAQWETELGKLVASGVKRPRAVSLVNRRNPGLRQRMLEEVNA
ncbi:MAG: head maturation protease, ClpP-related [Planctomycetota bacterium]